MAFAALLLAAISPAPRGKAGPVRRIASWMQFADLPDEWSPEQWSRRFGAIGIERHGCRRGSHPHCRAVPHRGRSGRGVGQPPLRHQRVRRRSRRRAPFSRSTCDMCSVHTAPTLVLRPAADEIIPASSSRIPRGPNRAPSTLRSQDKMRCHGSETRSGSSKRSNDSWASTDPVRSPIGDSPPCCPPIGRSTARATSLGDPNGIECSHFTIGRCRELAEYGGNKVDTPAMGSSPRSAGGTRRPMRIGHCGRLSRASASRRGSACPRARSKRSKETRWSRRDLGDGSRPVAGPSQVGASQTVKDLVAGSGLTFEDAGERG